MLTENDFGISEEQKISMIIKKRHNETNTSQLTQLEEKSNTLFSANSFFAKELSKARQDKALEKCSTTDKRFLEVMGRGNCLTVNCLKRKKGKVMRTQGTKNLKS